MPTNNNINYGPAPLPGTETAPVLGNNIDRAPDAVPPGLATGTVTSAPTPVVPVTEQPVVLPAVPPQKPVLPVVETPVDLNANANVTQGPNITAANQQRYITILANGVVVTNNATTLNFSGNGVTVSNLGTTGANIVITSGGGANYGNSNVSTLLAAFGSNSISTTGNVSAGYFLGDGSQLTGISSSGNFIVNGNSYANVVSPGGNVVVGANGNAWTFDKDGNLNFPNDANIAVIGNVTQFNTGANGFLSLNSYDAGGNNIAAVNLSSIDGLVGISTYDPATDSDYHWAFNNHGGTIFPTLTTQRGDNPSGTITGQTLLFGDSNQEAIISTPDGVPGNEYSQRLVINPGAGNNYGEGGDIYLWAGRGGNASGSGGDIKIRGGQGGANTGGGSGGGGGYIRIEAGDASSAGAPGYVAINGGTSATIGGGYVEILGGQGATVGGDANLKGGYGTATGGNVNIWGGASGNGQVNEGNVNIQTGGNTWTFDPSGNLTIPAGGSIYSEGFTPSGNPGNTITLNPHGSGSITNQKLLIYPTAGDGDHIHLTSGNLYQTELFLGSDSLFVKLANTGNIVINSDDNAGNTAQWKFGIDGNLTASGNLIIAGNTNVFGTDAALIQPTDDKPLIALSSGANGAVSSVWVEDIGNVGTSNIASVYANPIPGSGIVRIAVGQNGGSGPNLWDFNAAGNLTAPGNISAVGNISAGYFVGNGNTLSNVATKTSGSWTLASGVNTVTISVPLNGTYAIWVNGNIPNGIITYTATAVITNTNVPVLGEQYAWYYAIGNALVLTSIPNQFVGTVGSISNVNTYVGNTANVFTFGITNNSGNTAVVNYGYTKL